LNPGPTDYESEVDDMANYRRALRGFASRWEFKRLGPVFRVKTKAGEKGVLHGLENKTWQNVAGN